MREVPFAMTQVWRSGDYTGRNRPTARVTLQQARNRLHRFGKQVYATIPFGSNAVPRELPNVKSVDWNRNIDTDIATCTIEFWNTKPLPLGELPVRDFDEIGFYTYNRGRSSQSNRWGHTPNEWGNLLMPDNILRTYEGYGFNPDKPPEKDEHLVQTGTWMIDDVVYTHEGLITVTCRDLGRLLTDHIIHPPVVPDHFYPLYFDAVPKVSGFYAAAFRDEDEGEWEGPLDAPPLESAIAGNGSIVVEWGDTPEIPPEQTLPPDKQGGQAYHVPGQGYYLLLNTKWYHATGEGQRAGIEYLYGPFITAQPENIGPITSSVVALFGGEGEIEHFLPRYEVVGWRLYVDGVLMPNTLGPDARTATVRGLMNGNVYFVEVAAIYQELNTGRRKVGFRSDPEFFYPHAGGPVTLPFSLGLNDPDGINTVDGWVRWGYESTGQPVNWTIILYRGNEERRFTLTTDDSSGTHYPTLQTNMGNLFQWNALVYGVSGGSVGKGVLALRTQGGDAEMYKPPQGGVLPDDPPPARGRPAANHEGTVTSLDTRSIGISFRDSSHRAHTGDANTPVYGRRPSDAFDESAETYWLSPGNSSPQAMEWVEGEVNGETLVACRIRTFGKWYQVYVSVQDASGRWIKFNDTAVIPYDAGQQSVDVGARIPYVAAQTLGEEGAYALYFQRPIPNVRRVRITMTNLQSLGGHPGRRAGLRMISPMVEGAGINSGSKVPVEAFTPGPVEERQRQLVGPMIIGGAGDNPGTYEDYVDVVKLLCAWGGFFWPNGGRLYRSDGSYEEVEFGRAPFNLGPNIDPVLGARGGRVWGDFEIAGVAGVATLPVQSFDKRTLMDGISQVRDILGFLFYVDEEGSVVFKSPNIYTVGNDIANRAEKAGRTTQMVTIDEEHTLMSLRASLTSRNVRESIFVGTPDGSLAGSARGWNPNPIGLRRVSGWTDQHFASQEECQLMSELIALRQLFTYRGDSLTIPGYPRIQINDQVRIYEAVTSESYIHFVKGISSKLDHETGDWTYGLETHWLGERPFKEWVFDFNRLSRVTQEYLRFTGRMDTVGTSWQQPILQSKSVDPLPAP